MSKKVIGIDLGTGNSCVSVIENGKPVVITNAEGGRTTPSVIGFTNNGEIKVGAAAKRQAVVNPKKTVHSIKRFMGNTYDECNEEVGRVQYEVENVKGFPRVVIDDKKYTPQELSAMILQKMKKTAEDYLGEKLTDAVITVPARFTQDQRQATKEAGEIAGLNVLRIINEPTAAALAYGISSNDGDKVIAVIDSGQGTYDVSILEVGGGVYEVCSTCGDCHLGGDDFDQVIINWMVDEFKKDEGVDLSTDAMAMQRLKEAAEKAKIELSSSESTDINLPYITSADGNPKHMAYTLTRAKFENLASRLLEAHVQPIKQAMKDAKKEAKDFDEVILVGGTTRIPAIQRLVKEVFGKEPSHSVNPDEAVSLGAAIQGGILAEDESVGDIVLLDSTPLNIGIETINNAFATLIEANTTIPCKRTQVFTTAVNNQPMVSIRIAQGNRPLFSDNKLIGQFNLDNIPPAPKGVPQIEVTVDIDASSIVTVSAKDLGTGKEQHITIQNNNLSKDEIERMKAEAEMYSKQDEETKERLAKLNRIEGTINQIEKFIEDYKDKTDVLTEEDKTYFEEKLKQLNEMRENDNLSATDELVEEIQKRLSTVGSRVYANVNGNSNNSGNPFGDGMNFDNVNFGDMFNKAGTQNDVQSNQPSDEDEIQDAK